MKRHIMLIVVSLQFLAVIANAQGIPGVGSSGKSYKTLVPTPQPQERSSVDYPEVPRISAYEASLNYKAGKAILVQAGGEVFERRHIVGAFDLMFTEDVTSGKVQIPNFPAEGIEIYTYCY